jgi:hypothetical protein
MSLNAHRECSSWHSLNNAAAILIEKRFFALDTYISTDLNIKSSGSVLATFLYSKHINMYKYVPK